MKEKSMSVDASRVRKRLIRCFEQMFADALPEDVTQARMENVKGWDSMATWTLLMLVEEQMGVKIGLDQIPKLTSFTAFESFVAHKLVVTGAARN
jgi:acyl carrier protein